MIGLEKKNEARDKLLEALNPIMQKYMKDNNVEMIVDKNIFFWLTQILILPIQF